MAKKFLFVNTDSDYEESVGAFEQADHVDSSAGAGDAGKPIVLDGSGLLDASFLPEIDHGSLQGLGDDDHAIYFRVDGLKPATGNFNLSGNKIESLADPVFPGDATNKSYVDAVALGLRPKGNVRVATTANINIASAPASIDGVTLASGDRVLIWQQTDATENGIYDFNGSGSAMTRSADQDNDPLAEIVNGVFIPRVLEGSTYADEPFVITSVGTGTDGVHQIGTDDIDWAVFTAPSRLSAGNGIDITSNIVSVDLLDTDSGLAFLGTGNDELAIDFSTAFNDAKAVKASDLNSVANGFGASIIGIEDAGGYTSVTDVEAAIQELYGLVGEEDGVNYTVGTGGVTKGDLVYVNAADTVIPHPANIKNRAIGIALTTESAAGTVRVLANDTVVSGVLTSLTPTVGQKIYWNGSSLSLTAPTGSGSYVWLAGIAKNANDLHVEVQYVKKNS